tara:strand:+ start:3816 stop:4757 length:942 start_codon:yes stop_codon:yes gene_type:complete
LQAENECEVTLIPTVKILSRRRLLARATSLAASLAITLPVTGLVGCGGSESVSDSDSRTDTTDSAESDSDSSTDTSSDSDSVASDESLAQDNSAIDWASGGTDSMSAEYPNPFDAGYGNTCDLTSQTTAGPCYSDTVAREDISEGRVGLPTRLCFRLVDANCDPVAGAVVDIWHCDRLGVYSGDAMQSVNFCTGGDSEYTSNDFFRGTQTTDADGVVWFSTCFPGWYSSRAVHIHFIVSINNTSYVTSQVGFVDDLVDDILTSHAEYSSRGTPDTHNYNDTVFPSSGYEEYLLDTHKMSDGSMLAWKTLMINA